MNTNWVSHTPDKRPQDLSPPPSKSKDNAPPSPPTPYEKFFLPIGDQLQFLQAASHISSRHSRTRNVSLTSESIRTDEFASAAEDFESVIDSFDLDDISIEKSLYSNDILGLSSPIQEHEEFTQMGSKYNKKKAVNIVGDATDTSTSYASITVDSPIPTADESQHFDVVDHVYEGAKSIWAKGKDVSVFNVAFLKPFLGVAENVATKVLSVATGTDSLDSVDKNIKPRLKDLDYGLVDPALVKLWKILEPIVGKGDQMFKGMVNMGVHKPTIKN